MLITISGMVGSGKSTAANRIVRILDEQGIRAEQLRFQYLPCFTWMKRRPTQAAAPPRTPVSSARPKRWIGYRTKRLTAGLAAGYILRVLAFRAFRLRSGGDDVQVMDRYFYDSFVHFELRRPSERFYAAVLRRLIPKPDVSILLLVPQELAASRCPDYSADYLASVDAAYRKLPARFAGLVQVPSGPGDAADAALEAALSAVNRGRHAGADQRAGAL